MKIIDLENCPGIFIPCEDIDSLKILIDMMYEKEILQDRSFKLCKVPNGFIKELNQIGNTLSPGETVRISEDGDFTLLRE